MLPAIRAATPFRRTDRSRRCATPPAHSGAGRSLARLPVKGPCSTMAASATESLGPRPRASVLSFWTICGRPGFLSHSPRRHGGAAHAEAARPAAAPARSRRRAGDEGGSPRRHLDRRERHRQRADAGHLRSSPGARRRPFVATLHQDRGAARISLHRAHPHLHPSHLPHPSAPVAPAAPGDPKTIAVFDFTNVTGDEGTSWLSAGVAETVTADLDRSATSA